MYSEPGEQVSRVVLFSLDNAQIKVTIEAFFDSSDNLVVEGYDIGKTVEEYWGDSDYEYSATVPPEEVAKLYALLGMKRDSKQELLNYLLAHFHENDCYSRIREFFNTLGIRHEGFSWS